MNSRSFIESDFPVREISEESAREKNIRHGYISTFHIWWARKPLASSRASIYASLTPEPINDEERSNRALFIVNLCKWENSLKDDLIQRARREIHTANGRNAPKVLDPFAGGGAIPLEALRLGCETYASDLNPVAVLIEKCTLEYPQKYGRKKAKDRNFLGEQEVNPLLEDVKKWGSWVLHEAMKELGGFYPFGPEGSIPVGYYWMWTVACTNPSCNAAIPLATNLWLARKDSRKVALKLIPKGNTIRFEIRADEAIDFEPDRGTISRAKVVCPCCGSGLTHTEVRKQFEHREAGQRMVAVVLHRPKRSGKIYRIATNGDFQIFEQAERNLAKKRKELLDRWGFDPVPDEDGPPRNTHRAVGSQLPIYGFKKWGDLFNARQKLALITFVEKVRNAHQKIKRQTPDENYAKAVVSYLALAVDRLADFGSVLCILNVTGGRGVFHTFARQALGMAWNYFESNPLNPLAAGWSTACGKNEKWIQHASRTATAPAVVGQYSATALPYTDNSFDAVMTDPPYYDNVPYSDLSDFFYVWLKRTVGDLYPELFATPLTPKTEEIIQNSPRAGDDNKAKQFFKSMITKSFEEINRVLKPTGIACIVFAHKSTDAWETIINALLSSGLYLTASWPIHTEMKARLTAKETASLASSIYMVCRKRTEKATVYFTEVKSQIEKKVREKLEQFWNEGIGGSDFFVSAIGPAMEVFGRYQSVEKISGEKVSAQELLEFVRKSVSEYALTKILRSPQLGGVDEATRFYLLWRWTYGSAHVHFDDARKLAQAAGLEIADEWGNGFIKKDKELISVLSARERGEKFLEKGKFNSMIDALHASLLCWEENNKKRISELLEAAGYLNSNVFWQVAQAISDVLPEGDKEKQMLQGFLYGKEDYGKAKVRVDRYQRTLFEEDKK